MNNTVYEDKIDLGVYIPSVKSELYQIMNVDHSPKRLLNEIEWHRLEGILEHAVFHAKGTNILIFSLLELFHIFSIGTWKYGGCNTKLICIKCNNCDITVTYHLTSEE